MQTLTGSSENRRISPIALRLLARIQAELLEGARGYFAREGFTEVLVPRVTKVTGSCENMDTLFEVKIFGQQAYLMQTGQLFLEVLIPHLKKVWCYGPSFRAEAMIDNRHLAEFTLLEMEFCGNFEQLLTRIEDLMSEMVGRVLERSSAELEKFSINKFCFEHFIPPFQRITYDEAVKFLNITWGEDLKSEHEKLLVEKYGNLPIFITHYPEQIKFFNMKTNQENPRVVNSADLILPFSGETVGAAEREFEYDKIYEKLKRSTMLKQLENRGGSISDFDWYLNNLRENGSLQHAGCGIGLHRVTQFILNSNDIRESTLFPLNREKLM